jgi:hypothetical protein
MGFDGTAAELGLPETSFWYLPSNPDHTENAARYFLDTSFTSEFPYVLLTFPTAKGKSDVRCAAQAAEEGSRTYADADAANRRPLPLPWCSRPRSMTGSRT